MTDDRKRLSRENLGTRAKTISIERMSKRQLQVLAADGPPVASDHDAGRPKTEGECATSDRPCPWISCRYHLALAIDRRTGAIKIVFPGVELEDMKETCALDIADRGSNTLEEVGAALNVTRERTRQIEADAIRKLERGLRAFVSDFDDPNGPSWFPGGT